MPVSRWKQSCSRVIERLHARTHLDYRSSRGRIILYRNKQGTLCTEDGDPVDAGQLAPGTTYNIQELQ